jgi:hypothetical protein
MALTPLVLMDCRIYLQTADLTGFSNKAELHPTAAEEDKTTFASAGWKERVGGVNDLSGVLDGFWQAGDLTMPDDTFWANLGGQNVALTIVPTGGYFAAVTYLSRVDVTDVKYTGTHGKILPWAATVKGNWPLARGYVYHPQGTARTTSGTGTSLQPGGVLASQRMYVCYHAMSVSGTSPSMTVSVQSSVDNTWAAPTTRLTFNPSTGLDAQTGSVMGPVTDQWWRVAWTISGTSPSFMFAASMGIATK